MNNNDYNMQETTMNNNDYKIQKTTMSNNDYKIQGTTMNNNDYKIQGTTMSNSNDYRYRLDSPRVTGRRQQKTTCPQCGRKHCFVRYVDTQNGCRYVDSSCGRCDHEQSCGYHLTPRQLHEQQPWRRVSYAATLSQPRKQATAAPQGVSYAATLSQHRRLAGQPPQGRPFEPMAWQYVERSQSPHSTLWQWLAGPCATRLGITAERLQQVFADYHLGATRQGDVIFWQIDEQGQVHGGHIMHYRADGHRDGYQGWAHVRLISQGLLPRDWQLHQCLYGQHLLAQRPDAHVCVVESEKTALVMAAVHPEWVWLATCGCGGLTAERVSCLRGRRVTVFPDSGSFDKWNRQMQLTTGIAYNVSPRLEPYPPNTDLCDVLLGV